MNRYLRAAVIGAGIGILLGILATLIAWAEPGPGGYASWRVGIEVGAVFVPICAAFAAFAQGVSEL